MIELIAAFLLIALTVIYFLTRSKRSEKEEKKSNKNKHKSNTTNKVQEKVQETPSQSNTKSTSSNPKEMMSTRTTLSDPSKIVDPKSILLNSFREGKELRNPFTSVDGKIILFHDDKHVYLSFLNNFVEKNPKFLSKTVEQDVITDASFSEDKKIIAVGLKNTKSIVFYEIITENEKQKLNKIDKVIKTIRQFEINNVIISKDGNYVAVSGTEQDTLIQIYDIKSGKLVENVDTKEIKNVEMKMTPDDRALTVSTYMRNISVIEYKRTEKFNKDAQTYEVTMKPLRNKSVSGIKDPIDCFDFSNDNKFFLIGCENSKIKIFQNFGNFEDSKMFSEFTAKDVSSLNGDKVSLYITGFFNGKISGFVAISSDSDIYVYDTEGKLVKFIQNAHDTKISLIKLVQNTSETGSNPLLLSASRDARFHVWNINA